MQTCTLRSRPSTPLTPQTSSHNTASPSTMMLCVHHLRVTRPVCFLCTNRFGPIYFNFAMTSCHALFRQPPLRRSNQHHIVRIANRSQHKVVQSPCRFRGYPAFFFTKSLNTNSMIIVKMTGDSGAPWGSLRLIRTLFDETVPRRAFIQLLFQIAAIRAIENKLTPCSLIALKAARWSTWLNAFFTSNCTTTISFCHSLDSSAAFNSRTRPASACFFGTTAVCTLSYFSGG